MAFVFQSKKSTFQNKDLTNSPGPGKYNLMNKNYETQLEKYQKRRFIVPFNSETLRNDLPKRKKIEIENSPGPGSYYTEKSDRRLLKINDKKKDLTNQPLYKLVENNDNLDSRDFIPLGFNTGEKRFKTVVQGYSTPGPGTYDFVIGNEKKSVSSKKNFLLPDLNLSINNKSFASNSVVRATSPILFKQSQQEDYLNKVSTIPSKLHSYGYELSKEGVVVPSSDPLKFRKHLGNKKDSAGPGEYNLMTNRHWFQKGTNWGKSKTIKMKQAKSDDQSLSNISYEVASTQSQSQLDLNTTSKPIKRLNKNEKESLIKAFKQRQILAKEHKEGKEFSQLEQIIKSGEVPGPGYYFESNKSSFVKKRVPEEFQSFGSSSVRFQEGIKQSLSSNAKNNSLGPGSYFRDDSVIEIKKLKEGILNSKLKQSPINLENMKHTKERYETIKVKSEIPGPGAYTLPSKKYFVNPNSKGIFGSSEKKFVHIEGTSSDQVGPGKYLAQDNWIKNSREELSKLMNSPRKWAKPKLIDKALLSRERIEKVDIQPSVGTYNSDKINSIEYDIHRNANKFSLVNAPFSSLSKRFNENTLKNQVDLGPGYYYSYKQFKPKDYKEGFNSSESRNRDYSLEGKRNPIGPGQYNKESYFDWNKKSFNIQFL